MIKLTLINLILCILMLGCAYRPAAADRSLPGGYQVVAVPMFKNQTMEPSIETFFTNALVEELEISKVAKVAAKEDAEVIVEGIITKLDYKPESQVTSQAVPSLPTGTIQARQYRIYLDADLVLKRKSDGQVLWMSHFKGERTYSAPQITMAVVNSANAPYNQSARTRNIQLMAKDMMSEAHDKLTENF